jgi:hypothetical protein
VPVDLFRRERDAIRAEIETRGYSERLESYVATLDGDDVDASLLTLPLFGYADPASPRMRSTYARIWERLGRDTLVYRSEPTGREGTFGIFGMHLVNGWLFALVYTAAFESWRRSTWWLGGLIGLVHALFVLTAAMPLLPSMHPRMASEQHGPTPTRQLEPPGFLALNYGRRTPVSVVVAHVLYGTILGAFYRRSTRRR